MNSFILSLVSAIFVLGTASGFTIERNITDEKKPIIGGYFPANRIGFHVSLRCRNDYFCGGSLISPQHVLTAAHCLTFIEENQCHSDVHVLAGSNDRNQEVYIPAEIYIKHFQYSIGNGHDIAVIKLQYPFPMFGNIWAVKLTPYPPTLYEPITVTGYGRVHPLTNDVSVQLKAYDSFLLTYEECYKRIGDNVSPTEICDLGQPNVGTCQGDSGGPVFNGNYLIGVVSGGVSYVDRMTGQVQCNIGNPNFFTSVYHHLDFISYCLLL